jgi:hypothetical protein
VTEVAAARALGAAPPSPPPIIDAERDCTGAVTAMTDWFLKNHQDPALGMPWVDDEYARLFGPLDAHAVLTGIYGGGGEVGRAVDRAVAEIEQLGRRWIPSAERLVAADNAEDASGGA